MLKRKNYWQIISNKTQNVIVTSIRIEIFLKYFVLFTRWSVGQWVGGQWVGCWWVGGEKVGGLEVVGPWVNSNLVGGSVVGGLLETC